ncbi:MinD/ParA family ATP-binding protein [Rhodococcus aerolatus]
MPVSSQYGPPPQSQSPAPPPSRPGPPAGGPPPRGEQSGPRPSPSSRPEQGARPDQGSRPDQGPRPDQGSRPDQGPSGPHPYAPQGPPPQNTGAPYGGPPQQGWPGGQGQPQHGPGGPAAAYDPQGRPLHEGSGSRDLTSAVLLRQGKKPPRSGWRKAVYLASGRTINPGESEQDVRQDALINQVNQPLHGCYRIAMLSLKGGVGKTTTTVALGSTFASLRGDRVVAVDANPDRGTLSQKIPLETTATVRHLLRDAHRITRYSDVRAYTSQSPSRLEVLASESDPAVSEAFSEDDYRRTVDLLEHFYNIVLTDCGTGLMHSAMRGVLDKADALVLVSSGSIDGARSASATIDWLEAHGYRELVGRSVAVINSVRPASGKVDLQKVAEHFGARCRAVRTVPFDAHLEEGAEVELESLAPATRTALLELAATVADDFPYSSRRQRGL